MQDNDEVRIDKWLWAARFFKTRGQAATAIHGGKIEINGHNPKPSRMVVAGDRIRIRRGPFEQLVVVRQAVARRGSASVAALYYEETPESLATRQRLEADLKAQALSGPSYAGRPTKRDRRELLRMKGRAAAEPDAE